MIYSLGALFNNYLRMTLKMLEYIWGLFEFFFVCVNKEVFFFVFFS